MARVLAIDFGERRVGLAVSDELRLSMRPLPALIRTSDEQVIMRIASSLRELEIGEIVVGMPLGEDGAVGPQARRVRGFGDKLGAAISCPLGYVDETFTTAEARSMIRALGIDISKDKGALDSAAAVLILQTYLEG
jgi:putative Holliday junction resolvase